MLITGLVREVRVGRKRTIVIPKDIATILGIDEGSRIILEVKDNAIILKPLPDAVTLSIRGRKIARVSIEELEAASIEEQKKYIGEA
ncbi:AbrB/MazE/SpoVT family DNA-binding domain-containing protein [Thermogladius sp. 4427co]|uniref:AbrB/MazE/SpoVT family DNA-binding domain-containing protein n=1 Tax=Thermogladius sp. 4427co TaxID=3450718 RepID=UPI003F7AA259